MKHKTQLAIMEYIAKDLTEKYEGKTVIIKTTLGQVIATSPVLHALELGEGGIEVVIRQQQTLNLMKKGDWSGYTELLTKRETLVVLDYAGIEELSYSEFLEIKEATLSRKEQEMHKLEKVFSNMGYEVEEQQEIKEVEEALKLFEAEIESGEGNS